MIAPYYEEDGITIYNADCRDVLPQLEPVDLVITSPPYNLGASPWPHLGNWKPGGSAGGKGMWRNGGDAAAGIQYIDHRDAMPWPYYVQWQREILSCLWANLSPTGAIFYNHKPRTIGAKLWTPFELIPEEVEIRQVITWARPGGVNFNPTAFMSTSEWILLLAKPAFRLRSRGASGLGDVWKMAPDVNPHPAPFPLALPAKVFSAVTPDVVLDPFMGSGTTLVAAKTLGLKASGIEISKAYCDIAIERLRQRSLFSLPELQEVA